MQELKFALPGLLSIFTKAAASVASMVATPLHTESQAIKSSDINLQNLYTKNTLHLFQS